MFPILFKIGPLTIHTYGFFMAVGFLAGMGIVFREAGRQGIDPERVLDLCFYCLLAAVASSRVPYVIFNWPEFQKNLWEIVRIWHGGLVFYGGFVGAAAVYVYYVRRYKLPFWKTADLFALGVPLGHFFGRLGCFSAGCCYGKVCDLPWAVSFPDRGGLAPVGIPLHPTQLYEAAGNLAIFAFLYFVMRGRRKFYGQLFVTYIVMYATLRFVIEFLRGDDRGAYFLGVLSPSQTLALVIAAVAVFLFAILRKRNAVSP